MVLKQAYKQFYFVIDVDDDILTLPLCFQGLPRGVLYLK